MPSATTQPLSHEAPDPVQAAWQRIRAHLESTRSLIASEISHYPAPRPACDADFNHMLEQRGRITDELNRLHAATGAPSANDRRQIDDFIATSKYLDDACRQAVRALISHLPA